MAQALEVQPQPVQSMGLVIALEVPTLEEEPKAQAGQTLAL